MLYPFVMIMRNETNPLVKRPSSILPLPLTPLIGREREVELTATLTVRESSALCIS